MGTVTVSCRKKPTDMDMAEWFKQYAEYAENSPLEITGVFGFVKEKSPLYGGRIYSGEEITEQDLRFLKDNDMSLKLTLTAHKASRQEYEESRKLLNKYYYPGNSIAVVNDDLAKWIKQDYPNYLVEASVIKNVKWGDIEETLETYDTLVLTMDKTDALDKLKEIKEKDRIILFGNAGCAYTCPSKICYSSISKINKGVKGAEFKCSQDLKPREPNLLHTFDREVLEELGFHNFKFVTNVLGFGY